ncbi:MAG: hypothetical protein ABEI52_11005 [Halobacteriaceae archaeon]
MDSSERSSGASPSMFAERLDLFQQVVKGFGLGLLVTILLLVFFVLPGTDRSPYLYIGLSFVFAVASGLLFSMVFALYAAYLQVKSLS